jgi:hypothetical protein
MAGMGSIVPKVKWVVIQFKPRNPPEKKQSAGGRFAFRLGDQAQPSRVSKIIASQTILAL